MIRVLAFSSGVDGTSLSLLVLTKTMYSIVLQTGFQAYKNKSHKINTSFVTLGFGPSELTKLV